MSVIFYCIYFLMITILHYEDNAKRSKGTLLPHGYIKQNEDETRNYTQRNKEGTKT